MIGPLLGTDPCARQDSGQRENSRVVSRSAPIGVPEISDASILDVLEKKVAQLSEPP